MTPTPPDDPFDARPPVQATARLTCPKCGPSHAWHGLPCEATYLCECPTSLEGER